MKRILILCLFMFIAETSGECAATYFPPLQPVKVADSLQNYNNDVTTLPDQFANPVNKSYPGINQIEQKLFGRTYATQNVSIRLSRIEKSIFSTTYPNSTESQRIDNIISNFNQINKYPNISGNALSKIESKVFNQEFSLNSPERRIERLEEKIFGAAQSGDIDSRFEAVKTASKSYRASNQDPYASLPSQPRGPRGLSQRLSNAMFGGLMGGGALTGFTPQIDPFYNNNYSSNNQGYNSGYNSGYSRGYNGGLNNPYSNQYPNVGNNTYANMGSGGYGLQQGYRSNHGYSDSFQDFNSGAGVTILD